MPSYGVIAMLAGRDVRFSAARNASASRREAPAGWRGCIAGNRERKVRPAYFASHAAGGSSIGKNLARLQTSFAIVLGCGGKARHLRSRS
jgi:hypothetical protein